MLKRYLLLSLAVSALASCGGSSQAKPEMPTPNPAPAPTPVPPTEPEVSPPNSDYIGFESAPVRPIALMGSDVYVTNTSNNSVEQFKKNAEGKLIHHASIPVGLEPVALAVVGDNQLWVVNHLSDSVSILDVSAQKPTVERTLLVGDEPNDIVVSKGKVFISAAHRGQHLQDVSLLGVPGAGDPQLHTPGVGRADVWVFNPAQLGNAVGGVPMKIVSVFGDSPRGLAVSPDGNEVYVSVLHSGNQTSVVHEGVMCYGFEDDEVGALPCQVMDGITSPEGIEAGWLPGGRTAPGVNAHGEVQPWTAMIVKFDQATGQWVDTKGRNFSNGIRFSLPDKDVFAIDANTLEETVAFQHVGTTLFNMAVNPVSGDVFVSNTESNNAVRFEGKGEFGGSTVQGNLARTRITHINRTTGKVSPRHLNRHIQYDQLKAAPGVKQHSLSTPMQMAFSTDGKFLFTAVAGSNKVAIHHTEQLSQDAYWDGEDVEFDPTTASQNYLDVAGGPMGLSLNQTGDTLYVFTRYDNALVSLDIETGEERQRVPMFTPEPESFQAGRFMLYDASRSSSNGEASCASCHVSGDTDHLSWNLGDPDLANGVNPQPFPTIDTIRLGCDLVGPDESSCQVADIINGDGGLRTFASMKGPMMTQTMRGMSTHGHMHWRGDRSVGYFGEDVEQTLDERMSFKNFIVAFEGLLGLDIALPENVEASEKTDDVIALEQDMDKFADFMLSIALPPNPIRGLDNSLSNSAQLGANFFHGARRADGLETDVDINGPGIDGQNCAGCHGVDHEKGFYGTRGEVAHGGEIHILKVPHLRNLYTRVGMFGLPDRPDFLPSHTKEHQGEQVRGFGFLHDGATDMLVNFLRGGVFDNGEEGCPPGIEADHGCFFNEGAVGIPDEDTRQGLVDYMLEFDNDLAPIVGQQITLNRATDAYASPRVNLLMARASTPFTSKILGGEVTECDLVAIGRIDGFNRGFLYLPEFNQFKSDVNGASRLSVGDITTLAKQDNNSLTFTCAVPGQGWRMALDSNLDGILNGDES